MNSINQLTAQPKTIKELKAILNVLNEDTILIFKDVEFRDLEIEIINNELVFKKVLGLGDLL